MPGKPLLSGYRLLTIVSNVKPNGQGVLKIMVGVGIQRTSHSHQSYIVGQKAFRPFNYVLKIKFLTSFPTGHNYNPLQFKKPLKFLLSFTHSLCRCTGRVQSQVVQSKIKTESLTAKADLEEGFTGPRAPSPFFLGIFVDFLDKKNTGKKFF